MADFLFIDNNNLHFAAEEGELEYVKYCISAGEDVNEVDEYYGNIPLHYSAYKGHVDVTKELIAAGSDVNAKNIYGKTPLHNSAKGEIAKALIAAGADVNAKDGYGNTSLHHIYADDVYPWFDDEETYNRPYPNYNINIVEVLIAAGADVNAKNEKGMTPLHCSRKAEVVKALIAAGADVNAKSRSERTPLHCFRNIEIVKAFIAAGADINAKDTSGKTPLHDCDDIEIVEALIAAGADVNAKDNFKMTPSFYCKVAKIMKALIAAGADVNAKEKNEHTPLHYCFLDDSEDLVKIVKMLIAAGADINAETRSAWTNESLTVLEHSTIRTGKDLFRYAMLYSHKVTKPNFKYDAEMLNKIWNDCDHQVKNLKETFLGTSCVSFFNFLTETDVNKLALYSSEKNFNINNESERATYIEKFPFFEEDVEDQFIKGSERAHLLHKSQEILINYFHKSLPIEIIRHINHCLKNEDLESFLSLHNFNKIV